MSSLVHPRQLLRGDQRHGVNRYARELADATGCRCIESTASEAGQPLHVHFTDRLWGTSPDEAAERFEALALQNPISVTLHDLPQASDGPASRQRRADAYARVVRRSRAVACNSRWECSLLAGICDAVTTVIPLPVVRSRPTAQLHVVSGAEREIGLLGWIYPGKGHVDVIRAAGAIRAQTGLALSVVALGAVSDGHEAERIALDQLAIEHDVPFEITGYLSEEEMAWRASRVTVPVAAHAHLSASGSINSWLSLGRRPLVLDSPYAHEMAVLRPDTLTVIGREELPAALRRALEDPGRCHLTPDIDLVPDLDATAGRYLDWWSEEILW